MMKLLLLTMCVCVQLKLETARARIKTLKINKIQKTRFNFKIGNFVDNIITTTYL